MQASPTRVIRVRADADDFAQALLEGLPPGGQSDWEPTEIAATRARWRADVDAERPGILPVVEALQRTVPDDALIYSDMTQFAYAAKEVWDMARPGHWHHPTGFGTLGYALPAAIGGAMGAGVRGFGLEGNGLTLGIFNMVTVEVDCDVHGHTRGAN